MLENRRKSQKSNLDSQEMPAADNATQFSFASGFKLAQPIETARV
jgi:hypothetical protein